MEENKDDIIYDLDSPGYDTESSEGQTVQDSHADISEISDPSDSSDISEPSELSEISDRSDSSDISESEQELRRMVEEMGAETILEIIRDNRNAAIRQIISEVESSSGKTFPSGGSGAPCCTSIFELAALA